MRIHRFIAAIAVVSVLLGACGIPLDSDPEVISADELPTALQPGSSTTTTIPNRLSEDVTIFLVDPRDGDAILVPVVRQVPAVEGGAEVSIAILEQLLTGPTPEEREEGLSSSLVPAGDTPLSVANLERPTENQLVVVLSERPTIEGSDRVVGFAQLVFTLTELNDVDQVRFAVQDENGAVEDISVSTATEEGDVRRAVDREDFPTISVAGAGSPTSN